MPSDAVVSNGDEHYIYIEVKKNHYKQIAVKTGVSDMGLLKYYLWKKYRQGQKL